MREDTLRNCLQAVGLRVIHSCSAPRLSRSEASLDVGVRAPAALGHMRVDTLRNCLQAVGLRVIHSCSAPPPLAKRSFARCGGSERLRRLATCGWIPCGTACKQSVCGLSIPVQPPPLAKRSFARCGGPSACGAWPHACGYPAELPASSRSAGYPHACAEQGQKMLDKNNRWSYTSFAVR